MKGRSRRSPRCRRCHLRRRNDGASLALLALVPAAAPAVKEAHVLLYLPDVDVRFVGEDDARAPGALAAALDQALRGAAQRLARPPGLAAL